ncbi:MAG: hypothetical protein JST63_03910 [Bacteroidetes bacterium]|nr:hypothetical protein [Bacteroidota bacterium]
MANTENDEARIRRKIRVALVITMIGLLLNAVSAIPLHTELNILLSIPDSLSQSLREWLTYVNKGITETDKNYPFMRYGFDWLAFAHVLIAIAFIGPLKDPLKNEWVVSWGIIACTLSIVMALVWERLRDIPMWWSIVDALIAIIALIILWLCNNWIKQLKNIVLT